MSQFEIIVGNIGTVYSGESETEALEIFRTYKEKSLEADGRAAFEPVAMFRDGEPIRQHTEPSAAYRTAATRALQAWHGGACNVRALARELVRCSDAVCEWLNSNTLEALHGPAGAPLRVLLDQINHLCGPIDAIADTHYCETVPLCDEGELS